MGETLDLLKTGDEHPECNYCIVLTYTLTYSSKVLRFGDFGKEVACWLFCGFGHVR